MLSRLIPQHHSRGKGPQVNKFEQVSRVVHQISVAEGAGHRSDVHGGVSPRSDVWGRGGEGWGREMGWGGEGREVPYHMTYPILCSSSEPTDTSERISFACSKYQYRSGTVNSKVICQQGFTLN